jgi:purine-binding chemotaxis protein CheW
VAAELEAGRSILVFRTDDRFHALFLETVEKVEFAVEVVSLPDSPRIVLGVIDWRGTILPVLSMRRRLHLPERPVAVDDRLIIVRSSRRRFALHVEEVVRVASVPAERIWQDAESIAGAVRIEEDLVLIRDLDSFLDEQGESALEAALVTVGDAFP